jgi:D-lyxose ketol-isomerase
MVQLTRADKDGKPSPEKFTVQKDGRSLQLSPGDTIRLYPGESVNIPPGTIHQFWGEEGTGYKIDGVGFTLSSEISSVCDDWDDNIFMNDNVVRFPPIVEDEEARFYLCHEYPDA